MPCDHSTSFNGLIQDSKSLKKSLNSSISSDNPLWRSKSFAEGINPDISFSYIKDPTFFDKKMPSLASLNLSNSLTSQTKNYPPYLKSPFEMRLKPLNNCPNLNGPVKGLYCTKNTYYSDSQLKKHLSLDASSISSFGSSGSGSISRSKFTFFYYFFIRFHHHPFLHFNFLSFSLCLINSPSHYLFFLVE